VPTDGLALIAEETRDPAALITKEPSQGNSMRLYHLQGYDT